MHGRDHFDSAQGSAWAQQLKLHCETLGNITEGPLHNSRCNRDTYTWARVRTSLRTEGVETDSEVGDACARHIAVAAVSRWSPSFFFCFFTYICIFSSLSFFSLLAGIPHCTVSWVRDGSCLLLLFYRMLVAGSHKSTLGSCWLHQ